MRTPDLPEPYRAPLASIAAHFTILAGALNVWAARDDTQAQPDVRTAATAAITEIDRMRDALIGLRVQVNGEARASDEASDARADALLRRVRGENTEAGK